MPLLENTFVLQIKINFMKSILVPIDFSETSNNAVLYALDFACQLNSDKVVLFHALQPIVVSDPLYNIASTDIMLLKNSVDERLENYASQMRLQYSKVKNITYEVVVGTLDYCINEYCTLNSINYIVMGITGASELEAKLIGSNTLSVSEHTSIPLIIVPRNCTFKHISKVTLLSDYQDLSENLPSDKLIEFLDIVSPMLDVVHIDPSKTRVYLENAIEKLHLQNVLARFEPEFIFSDRTDFIEAVNDMIDENNIQLLISVSKQKSWFDKLFNANHTKQLAFHTTVPLMILHK